MHLLTSWSPAADRVGAQRGGMLSQRQGRNALRKTRHDSGSAARHGRRGACHGGGQLAHRLPTTSTRSAFLDGLVGGWWFAARENAVLGEAGEQRIQEFSLFLNLRRQHGLIRASLHPQQQQGNLQIPEKPLHKTQTFLNHTHIHAYFFYVHTHTYISIYTFINTHTNTHTHTHTYIHTHEKMCNGRTHRHGCVRSAYKHSQTTGFLASLECAVDRRTK